MMAEDLTGRHVTRGRPTDIIGQRYKDKENPMMILLETCNFPPDVTSVAANLPWQTVRAAGEILGVKSCSPG